MAYILRLKRLPEKCMDCPVRDVLKAQDNQTGFLVCTFASHKPIAEDPDYFMNVNPHFQDVQRPDWCPIEEVPFRNI